MDSLTFLNKATKAKRQPFYVVAGDEDFLKRQVLLALQRIILEEADPAFALSTFPADKVDFSTIRNELEMIPFLSPRRMVLIEQADPFVTRHRSALEKFVQNPSGEGVLVLEVKSWPANTKLAKLVPDVSTIACKALPASRLATWAVDWTKAQTGKRLAQPAAQMLIELVGPQMGLLDQEIRKLAIYVGERDLIGTADVDQLVGRSRGAEVFKIMKAVGDGNPNEALTLISRLFDDGEEPLRVLGALSSQLRKLAQAARLFKQGIRGDAMFERAGIVKWGREEARRQMHHLGQRRLDSLFDWLLEVDLGMKGASPLEPRLLLERLIVRMAKARV